MRQIASLTEERLPIICGGTHYFIQHFLFPPGELYTAGRSNHEDENESSYHPLDVRWKPPHSRPPIPEDLDPELEKLLDTFWTAEPVWPGGDATPTTKTTRPTIANPAQLLSLHRLLEAVDPREAGRWDWRDGRKVRRGLERWWERNGEPLELGIDDECSTSRSGRRATFKTLIFWVYEPLETLQPRLDCRVDRMVEVGACSSRLL